MYWHLQTPTEHNVERVMRNLTAFHAFSASCFRAAASHSELLATKRRDCLGTDNWEHLQLAELINLYKCCYFMRCFSQPWLNTTPYWFNTLLYGGPDLSVAPTVIMPALVIVSACSWENLTLKTDWHDVNGVCVFLLEGCTASRSQGTDLPSCISIFRLWPWGCQPLGRPLTAPRFTAPPQVSGLQQETSHRQSSEVSNSSVFPSIFF